MDSLYWDMSPAFGSLAHCMHFTHLLCHALKAFDKLDFETHFEYENMLIWIEILRVCSVEVISDSDNGLAL